MLAGFSTLLSPRHRLRSEASAPFQACHFQCPSMSTQRLDLPCSFPRNDAQRSQPIRPVGLSVEKQTDAKGSCSLKQKIRLPPSITTSQTALWEGGREIEEGFWKKERSLKRFSEQTSSDESCANRVKRKRSSGTTKPDASSEGERMTLTQVGRDNLWFQQMPQSLLGITGLDPPPQVHFPVSSGEEEKIFFVPGDGVVPPLALPNNPLMESVVTEITDKGEKDVDTTSQEPRREISGSTSSEGDSLIPRRIEISSGNGTGNGSQRPYPSEGTKVAAGSEDVHTEHQGFELVSLLVACVESISSNNIPAINHFIATLGELASPEGTSISRVIAYFTEALAVRVARLWPRVFHIATPRELDRIDEDMGSAVRLLNHVSPIPKFLHFTSNEILLRAFEGKDTVHIIDFDIKQGLQWPGLFQSLATRPNPPSHVRITGIGESKQELQETGNRLARFAETLNLPFEFHAVVDRLEDVRLWMLHVKEKESVAINCVLQLHKMLYDETGVALRNLLGLISSTNPIVVLMAEQEAMHNDSNLEGRVSNSFKYYSAIFDSIHSTLPLDSLVRIKIEEMFAREIRNIIACEGSDRLERHVSFSKWRKMMEHGGFRSIEIGEREILQSRMLLKMYSCENYSIEKQGEEGAAGLTVSWLEQPLYTVSAWAPVDVAASSSSLSQPS
ncbi:scarecrow-like protein 28 [Macadamia integrifolia]|uniref:scarecrow-like protein 28 n=1 Tax=Macadamia integrifolia TaxID=60698 RepID=UPI001C4EE2FF|nr:scarecrow-like protein 28 [Macadamia integrifolia]